MDRETKNIKIGKHEFVVKTYATAREANTVRQAYFIGTKVEVVGEQPKISEFNPGVQMEVHKEMIRQMVVSVDGNSGESIVETCLDLPSDVYDELVSQLDELVSKKKN